MVYLLQTEIVEKKSIVIALQKVFGIGEKKAIKICFFFRSSEKNIFETANTRFET